MFLNTRERYVQKMYEKMGIYEAIDIDEWRISEFFGIELEYHKGEPFRTPETIYLSNKCNAKQQRVDFFHELAHIIRQSTGNQLFVSSHMSDWLEWDADMFATHASLPWHLVRRYDLTDDHLVCHLSDDFMVPHDMVYKRLQQIKQRLTII